jgi:hypothetical protein
MVEGQFVGAKGPVWAFIRQLPASKVRMIRIGLQK